MLMGYQAAQNFDRGVYPVDISLFGRLRPLVGHAELQTQAEPGANVSTILHKFFDYYPETRTEALDKEWRSAEKQDSRWVDVHPAFVLRPGWRILLNGRDVEYMGGFDQPVEAHNKIAIFPPGR